VTGKRIIFLLLISLTTLIAGCQDRKEYRSTSDFFLLEDSTLTLTPEAAWKNYQSENFTRQTSLSFNAGFTTSHYWLVVKYDTASKTHEKLEIGSPQINVIEFYRIENNRPVKKFVTGDHYAFASRPEQSLNFLFELDQRYPYYLLKIDKRNESLQLTFLIRPANAFQNDALESSMIVGILSGLILLMLIFGVFLFLITGEKVYLFYTVYVACGWLYVIANLGYGYKYLWPDSPWFTARARPFCVLVTIGFSVYFINQYTGAAAWRWLRTSLQWLAYVSFALAVVAVLPVFDIKQNTFGYYFQALIPILVVAYLGGILTTLIQKINNKNRMAMFYLLSVIPIALFSTLQLFYYSGGLDFSGSYLQNYGQATGYVMEAIILTFGLAYRFNTYRKEKEQLLMSINQQQARYAKAIISTEENERRQIADQLHDVAGSLLSAAKLNLSSVREKHFLTQPEAQQKLTQAEDAVTYISTMLRNLSHAISPVMLDKVGFRQSVEKICNIFNSSGKLKVELEVLGFEQDRPELREKYSVLYGILYELVNNISKHAKATHALIQLIEHDESMVMIVEDNGMGLKSEDLQRSTQGLASIQSKIHYLNGNVTFDPATPSGLIVTIEIPKTNDDENYFSG
jgi:two-component system, sensor histidine kinase LadS